MKTQSKLVGLILGSTLGLLLSCGGNSNDDNIFEDYSPNVGSLKIALNVNVNQNQDSGKFLTYERNAASDMPAVEDLMYHITIMSADDTLQDFDYSYALLTDPTTLFHTSPGVANVSIEAYLPSEFNNLFSIEPVFYQGNGSVLMVNGYQANLEILLNQVRSEINQSPFLDLAISFNDYPIIESFEIPSSPLLLGGEITCSATVSDPDGDEFSTTWYIDGTPICENSAVCTYTLPSDSSFVGHHTLSIGVMDVRGGYAELTFPMMVADNLSLPEESIIDIVNPDSPSETTISAPVEDSSDETSINN